ILFYSAFLAHLAVIAGVLLVVLSVWHGDFESSVAGRLLEWSQSVFLGPVACLFGAALSRWLATAFSSPVWVWPFLVIVSAQVRRLLVEYVGDVTAYVASNKVDSFDELRTRIKALAKESL